MFYCLLCHQHCSPKKDVCDSCFKELPWNESCCSRCSEPATHQTGWDREENLCDRCQTQEPYFDQCLAPFRYQFPVDQLLLHGKGGKRPELLKPLTRWMAQHNQKAMYKSPDLLVPVPLHPHKQFSRGYNQAGLVAHLLGKQLNIPVSHNVIEKVREPKQQKTLSKDAREHNIRRSFRINREELRKLKKPVYHIAIVDDVITTGSTMNQLAKQLSQSGVENIDAWAIARTPRKR